MNSDKEKNADIIILNAMVVTMDQDYNVISDGAVVIRNDQIVDVGESDQLSSAYQARKVIDGNGKLVMPGLVNVHTHSPMTIYRGYADDLPLLEWLYEHIFPVEAKFATPDNVRTGTQLAVAEMLLSGTTCFNDTYYFVDQMAEVVDSCGIRAVLSESVVDFPAPNSPNPDVGLSHTLDLIRKWENHPLIRISASAHTPFTASADSIVRARQMAVDHGLIFNIHLSETRWEVEESIKKHGVSPVKFLDNLGVLDSRTIAAHCVHLDDEDIDIFTKKDVAVGHNPQCNMKLANGVAPIQKFLDRGLRVGIGTDGVASNNDLDMFDEMRSSALAQKLSAGDPSVLKAQSVVEMGTIMGARAIGMGDIIGSIEPGKKADVILLDLGRPHAIPHFNVYSLIAYSLRGSDVETVIVNGQMLVDQRKLLTVDLETVYQKVKRLSKKLKAFAGMPKVMGRSFLA